MAGADRVAGFITRDPEHGVEREIRAAYVLDATENGDRPPLAAIEPVTGAGARADTANHPRPKPPPPRNPGVLFLLRAGYFVLKKGVGEHHLIPRPAHYDFWRNYLPQLTPPWPRPPLGWAGLNPRSMDPTRYDFDPHREKPGFCSGFGLFPGSSTERSSPRASSPAASAW